MRALISVSDKTGVVEFAKGLVDLGWEIISTGGTSRVLKEAGMTVIDISSVTNFPEIMDGRVKTLHPSVHGGLLALRDNPEHMKTIKELNIRPIDLVCVNLYPFEQAIANPNNSLAEIIENIDIGGPSMVRSAAKNYKDVVVVVNPDHYSEVLEHLRMYGNVTDECKDKLAIEAYTHTARYDAIISNYLRGAIGKKDAGAPDNFSLPLDKGQTLRYGENPHQKATFYRIPGEKGVADMKQLHGKELSFNNYIDLDSAWNIAKEFDEPAIAILKHTNPCGAAVASTLKEAYIKALASDPISAFGSIIGCNREVDPDTAEEMSKLFVEVVVAPGYSKEALEILTKKKNIRLMVMEDFFGPNETPDYKRVTGGLLVQDRDTKIVTEDMLTTATEITPDQKLTSDLLFGWKIVKHIKSNAILLVKDGATVGVGAGQMSRVDAAQLAVKKAGDKAAGSILASDAFFPFRDAIDSAQEAGITAIIQPGGSVRDEEVINACNEHKLPMVFTGIRHFKH